MPCRKIHLHLSHRFSHDQIPCKPSLVKTIAQIVLVPQRGTCSAVSQMKGCLPGCPTLQECPSLNNKYHSETVACQRVPLVLRRARCLAGAPSAHLHSAPAARSTCLASVHPPASLPVPVLVFQVCCWKSFLKSEDNSRVLGAHFPKQTRSLNVRLNQMFLDSLGHGLGGGHGCVLHGQRTHTQLCAHSDRLPDLGGWVL